MSRIGVSISPISFTCVEPVKLAVCVAQKNCAWHALLIKISSDGQDRGDTCANVFAADDRGMPDFNSGNIRDGIQRPGWQHSYFHSQVTCTRTRFSLSEHYRACGG